MASWTSLGDKVRKREEGILGNIFLSEDDRRELDNYLKGLYNELSLTRQELEKLDD